MRPRHFWIGWATFLLTVALFEWQFFGWHWWAGQVHPPTTVEQTANGRKTTESLQKAWELALSRQKSKPDKHLDPNP